MEDRGAGTGQYTGTAGSNGDGIRIGFGSHVTNTGTVSYGDIGSGANAVDIVGSNNVFEIWSTSVIMVNVVVKAGRTNNAFVFGGIRSQARLVFRRSA